MQNILVQLQQLSFYCFFFVFDRHKEVHQEPSIPCPHPGCGKLFKRKDHLAQHLRGEYILHITYVRNVNNLLITDINLRRHTSLFWLLHEFLSLGCHYPREYECLVCHRRFQHRGVIQAHLKGQHDLVDIEQFYARQRINVNADLKSVSDQPMTAWTTSFLKEYPWRWNHFSQLKIQPPFAMT